MTSVLNRDFTPLRILVAADVPSDPNAGASGTVYQMNRALRALGHTVDEIWQPDLGRRIRHGNLHYLLELPHAYCRELQRNLAKSQYDVVEFNQPHAYRAARQYRRVPNRGIFVNRSHGHEVRAREAVEPWQLKLGKVQSKGIRGLMSLCLRPWLDRHWRLIANSSDGFHVSCREDADFIRDRYGVPEHRIGVIRQGVPDLFLKTAPPPMTTPRSRRLLYVGQMSFVKAPMILASSVSKLLQARQDLTMTWVCSAEHHAEVRRLLADDVQSRVNLSHWRPQDELMSLYDEHGVFLFPSFFEGFGKAPLEAMARGMCVVASDTGGMRDVIMDGKSGMLVPIGDADETVRSVLYLIENQDVCQSVSTVARLEAAQHTWEDCAGAVTQFYRRLLRDQETRPARFARHSSDVPPAVSHQFVEPSC
jgi:glycosyltransferase involved in cell wall biosynthesis